MVGILVIGHGKVASGLVSAAYLIAGRVKELYAIDFSEDVSIEEYKFHLEKHIDDLLTRCDSVLIFTDLPGGTPFQIASKFACNIVQIVTSVSVTMLLEIILARKYMDNILDLIDIAISTGKEHIQVLPMDIVEGDKNA